MIDLGSIAGLYERHHEVHCYCCKCERWRVLDLQRLVNIGRGTTRLPLRVRCLRCRESGQVQIRPPVPKHSNANGWAMPGCGAFPIRVGQVERLSGTGRTQTAVLDYAQDGKGPEGTPPPFGR